MNAVDHQKLLNALQLAKQILSFYANESNYEARLGNDALVLIDKGHQAKYGIETIGHIVEPDYAQMERDFIKTMKDEAIHEHQKVEIDKALKEMGSIIDEYKKQYDELLDSGMFYEKFPELSGHWGTDRDKFIEKLLTGK